MSKRLLSWLIITSFLDIANSTPYYPDINQTLSETAWHLFRSRNQNIPSLSREYPLLFEALPPVPPRALLSTREMLFILGPRFFNPNLLAISQPQESIFYPQGQLIFPKEKRIHLRGVKERLSALRLHIKGISERRFGRIAAVSSVCPILYTWHDYGEQYWPRWVKEGRCVNLGGTSCSLPPGMFCVGYEEATVVLLRYVCPPYRDETACNWYRMQKPILISCKCACR